MLREVASEGGSSQLSRVNIVFCLVIGKAVIVNLVSEVNEKVCNARWLRPSCGGKAKSAPERLTAAQLPFHLHTKRPLTLAQKRAPKILPALIYTIFQNIYVQSH